MPIQVTFQQKSNRQQWDAIFDLGSDMENRLKALEVAWKHNASIVKSSATEMKS